MKRNLAYLVYYAHFSFMGFIFFGKSFTPLGIIDVVIAATVLLQVIYKVCPLTTLEEFLFKEASIPYTYKSWTKWVNTHFGNIGHLFSLCILWSISEITFMLLSTLTNTPYTNFVIERIMTFF